MIIYSQQFFFLHWSYILMDKVSDRDSAPAMSVEYYRWVNWTRNWHLILKWYIPHRKQNITGLDLCYSTKVMVFIMPRTFQYHVACSRKKTNEYGLINPISGLLVDASVISYVWKSVLADEYSCEDELILHCGILHDKYGTGGLTFSSECFFSHKSTSQVKSASAQLLYMKMS